MYFTAEDIHETSLRHLSDYFKTNLNQDGKEEDIQQFLTENLEILARGFIRQMGFIIPKFKFGTEYISDFLIADWLQIWNIYLIELEPKEAKTFNKDGTPAKHLSQAMKQLAEWNQWIENHKHYFVERITPHVEKLISRNAANSHFHGRLAHILRDISYFNIHNVAILGRRDEKFSKEQKRRSSISKFTGNNLAIISYDWLLDLVDDKRAYR